MRNGHNRHKSKTVIITPDAPRPAGMETHEYTHKKIKYFYRIWPAKYPHGYYFWEALGNGSKCPTKDEASETARMYIQYGPQQKRQTA